MTAILTGSTSTLPDTSEPQRRAFDDAFAQHGPGWSWDQQNRASMLATSGGQRRIAEQASQRGRAVDVDAADAAAVHATTSRLFQRALAATPPPARPGVVETIAAARQAGVRVGLVTTTSSENVEVLLGALEAVQRSDLDVVMDSSLSRLLHRPDPTTRAVGGPAAATAPTPSGPSCRLRPAGGCRRGGAPSGPGRPAARPGAPRSAGWCPMPCGPGSR